MAFVEILSMAGTVDRESAIKSIRHDSEARWRRKWRPGDEVTNGAVEYRYVFFAVSRNAIPAAMGWARGRLRAGLTVGLSALRCGPGGLVSMHRMRAVAEYLRKSAFNIFQGNSKQIPASMIDRMTTHAMQRMTSYRETATTHNTLSSKTDWATLQRTRNVKRHLWTSRPWRKSVAGHSYLRADGYITRIEAGSAAWRFEVRAIGATEICRCGDGFRSVEAARLAAFDAITDLLLKQAGRPASL
ncbi:hypothetical protein [Ralstonia pseudosolanacearum]|uniref:hypothetical protein n=2 Tax=Ralstonia pseudosolanacearum TaxID=1310165 RepID=UPI003394805E